MFQFVRDNMRRGVFSVDVFNGSNEVDGGFQTGFKGGSAYVLQVFLLKTVSAEERTLLTSGGILAKRRQNHYTGVGYRDDGHEDTQSDR